MTWDGFTMQWGWFAVGFALSFPTRWLWRRWRLRRYRLRVGDRFTMPGVDVVNNEPDGR
jgi:hypothetical protein